MHMKRITFFALSTLFFLASCDLQFRKQDERIKALSRMQQTDVDFSLMAEKEGYRKVVREKVVVKTEGGIRLDVEMEESPYELSPSPFHFFRTDE